METPNNTFASPIEQYGPSGQQSRNNSLVVQGYNFWKYETKMIVVSSICFIISAGCITILILDRSNCALNNGIFGVLGSIIGLMTGLFSSRSGRCGLSSSRSASDFNC